MSPQKKSSISLKIASGILEALAELREECNLLDFQAPVYSVYNPYHYAWGMVESYIQTYAHKDIRVLFLGMNPGPWGMAQTGIPFGEVSAVRDWLGLHGEIHPPANTHPARPVEGFACTRSEVSGRRFWGLMQKRFGAADSFFREHFVLNYCPLMFLKESGANLTPDKLSAAEQKQLSNACDRAVLVLLDLLKPTYLVGVGAYATSVWTRLQKKGSITRILHPSPANPAANRGWEETVEHQLAEAGVWPSA